MSETKVSEEYLKSLETKTSLTDKEKHTIRNYYREKLFGSIGEISKLNVVFVDNKGGE